MSATSGSDTPDFSTMIIATLPGPAGARPAAAGPAVRPGRRSPTLRELAVHSLAAAPSAEPPQKTKTPRVQRPRRVVSIVRHGPALASARGACDQVTGAGRRTETRKSRIASPAR